jgi:hypothetical protein
MGPINPIETTKQPVARHFTIVVESYLYDFCFQEYCYLKFQSISFQLNFYQFHQTVLTKIQVLWDITMCLFVYWEGLEGSYPLLFMGHLTTLRPTQALKFFENSMSIHQIVGRKISQHSNPLQRRILQYR